MYEQQRQRRKVPPFVGAGRARAHVRELLADGMTVDRVARRAGLSQATVYRLLGTCCGYEKSRRIRPRTERALLSVYADGVGRDSTLHADRRDPEPWFLFEQETAPPGVDTSWRVKGACRDPSISVDVFFPYRGDLETGRAARAICAGCTVRERCLAYAARCRHRRHLGRHERAGTGTDARQARRGSSSAA